jgi:23S rRNA (adenine2503-C2)-methyltransferase
VKTNLLNFSHQELTKYFTELGDKPFRASQIMKWVYKRGITDFAKMTDLSLELRAKLADIAVLTLPTIANEQISSDGTRKWLIKLADDNFVETVFIPEDDRGTLCVSSQVGCPLNCSFCATAKLGFKRNLETSEIVGQLWLAIEKLGGILAKRKVITNVVLMGMGEPLLNFDNAVRAMNLMLDDLAYGLSKLRVTVSTAGIVPALQKLRDATEASVAISLHAPNNELRSKLMPINDKYPLPSLIKVCKNYFKDPRRAITIEYVMLDGINDSKQHAKELVKLLSGVHCKINLIRFNDVQGSEYRCSSQTKIDEFRDILFAANFNTITRKTRGADIAAACGQLAGITV